MSYTQIITVYIYPIPSYANFIQAISIIHHLYIVFILLARISFFFFFGLARWLFGLYFMA